MTSHQENYPVASFLYADLREKWKHEDELINQRVTWLLNSQAFLMTAYGIVANLRIPKPNAPLKSHTRWDHFYDAFSPQSLSEILIVVSAMFAMVFLRHGIFAALMAMDSIKIQLTEHQAAGRIWARTTVDVASSATKYGAAPARAMANTFLVVWLILALYEILRIVLPFIDPAFPIV